jgi:hypothetical protein
MLPKGTCVRQQSGSKPRIFALNTPLMAKRNRHRAARRNEARARRNALAVAAAAELAADSDQPAKHRYARSIRMLDWLLAHRTISAMQFAAGDRLYRDFRVSGSEKRITMLWEAPTFRSANPYDSTIAVRARERFEAALREAGQFDADCLMHCVICDLAPTQWARLNGFAKTRGVPTLRSALDALADFYRIRADQAAA